jgi:hypothetical protein
MPQIIRYANPYLVCTFCKQQVTEDRDGSNYPCDHVAGTRSTCPTWSPIDDCTCRQLVTGIPHPIKSAHLKRTP